MRKLVQLFVSDVTGRRIYYLIKKGAWWRMNLEHAFCGHEFLLEKFAYQFEISGLFKENDGEVIEAFLQQHDFSDESVLFDTFRFHYLCFKTAYTRNSLPF